MRASCTLVFKVDVSHTAFNYTRRVMSRGHNFKAASLTYSQASKVCSCIAATTSFGAPRKQHCPLHSAEQPSAYFPKYLPQSLKFASLWRAQLVPNQHTPSATFFRADDFNVSKESDFVCAAGREEAKRLRTLLAMASMPCSMRNQKLKPTATVHKPTPLESPDLLRTGRNNWPAARQARPRETCSKFAKKIFHSTLSCASSHPHDPSSPQRPRNSSNLVSSPPKVQSRNATPKSLRLLCVGLVSFEGDGAHQRHG